MIYLLYFIYIIIGFAFGMIFYPEEPLAIFVCTMFLMIADIWLKVYRNDND